MIKYTIILVLIWTNLSAQSPFDDFNVDNKKTNIHHLEDNIEFKIVNEDKNALISYGILRDNKLYFYDKDEKVVLLYTIDYQEDKFLSRDPLEAKYPEESPYIAMGVNPINNIDPDGREKVGVIGGPDNSYSNSNVNNFYDTGLLQFDNYLNDTQDSKEKVTMIFFNSFDNKAAVTNAFKEVAGDRNNFELVFINKADELTKYLNFGIFAPLKDNPRNSDPITSLSFFGHGRASTFEPGYEAGFLSTSDQIWDISQAKKLKASAFKDASIDIYSCRSAENADGQNTSLASTISVVTASQVTAWTVKTDYMNIYNPSPPVSWDSKVNWHLRKIIYDRKIVKADNLPKGVRNQNPIIFNKIN